MKIFKNLWNLFGLVIFLFICLSCYPAKTSDPILHISIKDKYNKNLAGAWYKIGASEKVYFDKNSVITPPTGSPIIIGAEGIEDEVTVQSFGQGLTLSYQIILDNNVSANSCTSSQQMLKGAVESQVNGTLQYLRHNAGTEVWTNLSTLDRYDGCFPEGSDNFCTVRFKRGDKNLTMKIKKKNPNSDTSVNVVLVEES